MNEIKPFSGETPLPLPGHHESPRAEALAADITEVIRNALRSDMAAQAMPARATLPRATADGVAAAVRRPGSAELAGLVQQFQSAIASGPSRAEAPLDVIGLTPSKLPAGPAAVVVARAPAVPNLPALLKATMGEATITAREFADAPARPSPLTEAPPAGEPAPAISRAEYEPPPLDPRPAGDSTAPDYGRRAPVQRETRLSSTTGDETARDPARAAPGADIRSKNDVHPVRLPGPSILEPRVGHGDAPIVSTIYTRPTANASAMPAPAEPAIQRLSGQHDIVSSTVVRDQPVAWKHQVAPPRREDHAQTGEVSQTAVGAQSSLPEASVAEDATPRAPGHTMSAVPIPSAAAHTRFDANLHATVAAAKTEPVVARTPVGELPTHSAAEPHGFWSGTPKNQPIEREASEPRRGSDSPGIPSGAGRQEPRESRDVLSSEPVEPVAAAPAILWTQPTAPAAIGEPSPQPSTERAIPSRLPSLAPPRDLPAEVGRDLPRVFQSPAMAPTTPARVEKLETVLADTVSRVTGSRPAAIIPKAEPHIAQTPAPVTAEPRHFRPALSDTARESPPAPGTITHEPDSAVQDLTRESLEPRAQPHVITPALPFAAVGAGEAPAVATSAPRVERLQQVIAETVARMLVSDPLHDGRREVRLTFAPDVLPDTEVRLWRQEGRVHVEFTSSAAVAETGLQAGLGRLAEAIHRLEPRSEAPTISLRLDDGGQPGDGRSRQRYVAPDENEHLT